MNFSIIWARSEVSFVKYNICSISFRHELVSIQQLIRFAKAEGFSGIELWGVHAAALFRNDPEEIPRIVNEMQARNINVSMISDYVQLNAPQDQWTNAERKWQTLITLALLFRTDKIRIFAGNQASAAAIMEERMLCINRLRQLAEYSSRFGVYLVIETHPDTYSDTLESTIRLLNDVDHDHVRINLDFLHMWEVGCEPLDAYRALKPWIVNYHMKNVATRDSLDLFSPCNVYSPNGIRSGMTKLADGMIDYTSIIKYLESEQTPHAASIEWFGDEPHRLLHEEMTWLKQVESLRTSTSQHNVHGGTT